MVEIFFGRLTEKAIRRGIFHSVPDLTNAIDAVPRSAQPGPKPVQVDWQDPLRSVRRV